MQFDLNMFKVLYIYIFFSFLSLKFFILDMSKILHFAGKKVDQTVSRGVLFGLMFCLYRMYEFFL